VRHQDRLGTERLVVKTSATVTVTAGSDFVVKGTVYFVFFCSVYTRESVSHFKELMELGFLERLKRLDRFRRFEGFAGGLRLFNLREIIYYHFRLII
jgi:hypothetical protein